MRTAFWSMPIKIKKTASGARPIFSGGWITDYHRLGRSAGSFLISAICGIFLFRRVRGVEGGWYFPLFHILADAVFFILVFNVGLFLRPFYQAFKVDFVTAGNNDIVYFFVLDCAADCFFADAENARGLGYGEADWFCCFIHINFFKMSKLVCTYNTMFIMLVSILLC